MREGVVSGAWTKTVLVTAVGVLLAAGVINVLIAVTEAVLWPVGVGVGWVVAAASIRMWADAAAVPRSRTPHGVSASPPQKCRFVRGEVQAPAVVSQARTPAQVRQQVRSPTMITPSP